MQAKLFTAAGGYVTIVDVPPFVTGFPKVLIWGERIFTLTDQLQSDGLGVYGETFTYVVPSSAVALSIERMKAAAIPVDRSARVLTDGSPVTADHRELLPSGQQKGYVVLSAEERAKGFVRPVRRTYRHATCGALTTMGLALAETYARDPSFYSGTFCVTCGSHFPLDQFVWDGTTEQVGQ